MSTWLLHPFGPIVARDGRPFGTDSGNRMKLTPWLYPSVAAGSFRTMVGKSAAEGFTDAVVGNLKKMAIAGPLPYADDQIYFPAPRDIVRGEDGAWLPLRPVQYRTDEGTDLPGALLPVTMSDSVEEDFKSLETPPWWSLEQMTSWLLDNEPNIPASDPKQWIEQGFMASPETDLRTHVALDDGLGASEDGLLFQTAGFQFDDRIRLTIRVFGSTGDASGIHPFGGERRLAAWQQAENDDAWKCPPAIANELSRCKYLRMILATPAIFNTGWKPGWLGSDMRGTIPGTQVKVRLAAACVARWRPVSGWSLETGNRGEKPVRRVVPAGSVYFFERESWDDLDLMEAWLKPVSDGDQFNLDGFGVALWGRWKPEGEKR